MTCKNSGGVIIDCKHITSRIARSGTMLAVLMLMNLGAPTLGGLLYHLHC